MPKLKVRGLPAKKCMNAELVYAPFLKEFCSEWASDPKPESGQGKPGLFCVIRKGWKPIIFGIGNQNTGKKPGKS